MIVIHQGLHKGMIIAQIPQDLNESMFLQMLEVKEAQSNKGDYNNNHPYGQIDLRSVLT